MTDKQYREIRSLIKSHCANYYDGNCLLLNWHTESCQCPQMLTRSLVCRWFKNAVLPIDRELNEEIRKTSSQHLCRDCGDRFYPEHCNTLFCPKCRLLRARESKRKWAAKNRGRHYLGVEIDEQYCLWAEQRLEMADDDKEIQGFVNGVFWERNSLSEQNSASERKKTVPESKRTVEVKRGMHNKPSLFDLLGGADSDV